MSPTSMSGPFLSPPMESRWIVGYGLLRCWTRKEAYLKALGTGLATPLHSFEVTIDPGDARLISEHDRTGTSTNWQLRDLDPADGYIGAIAAHRQKTAIYCWRLVDER